MNNVVRVKFRKNQPRLEWKRIEGRWVANTGVKSTGWRLEVYTLITVVGDHQENREFDDDVMEMWRAEQLAKQLVRKRFGGVL